MTRKGNRDWLSYFKTEDGNIFFGWYTVLVSSLTGLWQAGTWYYGFGAYFKPLSEEFGWTRATTSALWSLGRFEGGLEGPFGGIATDKWGPRAIHFISVVLSGLGFVLMYFTRDFTTCLIFWIIASIGFNLGYAGPLDKAVTEWFVKKRGMAITIGRLGRVVGGTVMPPIMTFLLLGYGWRISFVIMGVVTWIIGLPTAWYLIKPRRPEYYGMLPDGEPATTTDTEELIKIGDEYSASLARARHQEPEHDLHLHHDSFLRAWNRDPNYCEACDGLTFLWQKELWDDHRGTGIDNLAFADRCPDIRWVDI